MPTRKGRKFKPRRTARGHRQSTSGTISKPIDIRSKGDIGKLLKLIRKGPITFVLVYADWCGHCHEFMPHFDSAVKNSNHSANKIKVNETVMEDVKSAIRNNINHSAKALNVEGYPSVLIVDNKGNELTKVEPVKNTAVMTKVMNESAKLASQAGITTQNNVNSLPKPTEMEEDEMGTSMGSVNKRTKNNKNMGPVESASTPDFVKSAAMNIDTGEEEGVSAELNLPKNTKTPFESSAPNESSAPRSSNNSKSIKQMEQEAEQLANLRSISANGPTIMSPPTTNEDQESQEPVKRGGSLYSAMAQTAYTLAPPAALLATAALMMKRNHLGKKARSKTQKRRRSRRSRR